MNKPYLIQRAKFENRDSKKGIDAILKFDYMGAAEFEFGALPQSLNRVRQNISNYTQFEYLFTSQPAPIKIVTVFCKKEQEDFVPEILEGLACKKYKLKEYCDMHEWLNGKAYLRTTNDFWWDIENDWFFWKFSVDFDVKFKDALISGIKK